MPQGVSTWFATQKNLLQQKDPWIYLIELDLGNGTWFRVTNHVQPITYNGNTWNPWPFQVGDIKASSKGETQTVDVVVGDAQGYLAPYLRANCGLIGRSGNIYKLNKANLSDPAYSVIPAYFTILTPQEDQGQRLVTFTLSFGVDVYQIEGPIGDYTLATHPQMPGGIPTIGQQVV